MPLAAEHVARSAASGFIATCPIGSLVLPRERERRRHRRRTSASAQNRAPHLRRDHLLTVEHVAGGCGSGSPLRPSDEFVKEWPRCLKHA
jgi:hypothetical protein